MNSELVEPQLTGGDGASMGTPTEPRARLESRATTFATAGGAGR